MIPVIKIGNDFNLRLIVRRGDGTAEDFDGVEKIEVQAVKNGAAWVTVLPNSYYYGIDGIVVANFVADDTLQEGEYRVKVKYTKDGRRYLAENCQAFLLTTCCSQLSTDTAESIDVTLDVQFSSDGKDGLSAYELAVANGEYTGDYNGYQKWLASLAGEVSVESANEYTDGKLIPINEYLNSIKNNIVKKNGDVEIKANDAATPATAKIYVNQNYLDLDVKGKGIHIDNIDTEFIGHHPRVEDADILPYSKDSSRITTCKNIEQKFNNFDFIRTVSDPTVTDENAGGKIYSEIRSTSDGHQLDIAVYPTNGVNRGEHNVDEASTRLKMDAYGIIDVVSKDGKITIAAPSVALKGDARYNPKNFPSSQSIINRKYADSRFIYWCDLYITHFANYGEFENFLRTAQMSTDFPTLLLGKLDDGSGVCVFLGEMIDGIFVESRIVYGVNYFLFHYITDNNVGITDGDGNAIQSDKLYRFETALSGDAHKYLFYCDINPLYRETSVLQLSVNIEADSNGDGTFDTNSAYNVLVFRCEGSVDDISQCELRFMRRLKRRNAKTLNNTRHGWGVVRLGEYDDSCVMYSQPLDTLERTVFEHLADELTFGTVKEDGGGQYIIYRTGYSKGSKRKVYLNENFRVDINNYGMAVFKGDKMISNIAEFGITIINQYSKEKQIYIKTAYFTLGRGGAGHNIRNNIEFPI